MFYFNFSVGKLVATKSFDVKLRRMICGPLNHFFSWNLVPTKSSLIIQEKEKKHDMVVTKSSFAI
jgi:hypothetical protein